MSITIDIIKHENKGFSIWIDDNQDIRFADLIQDISPLGISGSETVYKSFGPAEIIEKYSTKDGDFFISIEFDEFAGISIYSDNPTIMDEIFNLLLSTGKYSHSMTTKG